MVLYDTFVKETGYFLDNRHQFLDNQSILPKSLLRREAGTEPPPLEELVLALGKLWCVAFDEVEPSLQPGFSHEKAGILCTGSPLKE
jgi:hypothetical protein